MCVGDAMNGVSRVCVCEASGVVSGVCVYIEQVCCSVFQFITMCCSVFAVFTVCYNVCV